MNSNILVECSKLQNFCIDPITRETDLLFTSTIRMASSRFEYVSTRIEDDSNSFIESTVFQACNARDINVDYINHQIS